MLTVPISLTVDGVEVDSALLVQFSPDDVGDFSFKNLKGYINAKRSEIFLKLDRDRERDGAGGGVCEA